MSAQLTLTPWKEFSWECPRDMQILHQVIKDYNEQMTPERMVLA